MGLALGAAALGMTAAGGVMSYKAQKEQGKEAMRMAEYQSKLGILRAGVIEKQGAIEQRAVDISYGQRLGIAKTMIASNGLVIGAGSAGDYELDAASQHGIEKAILAENTGMKAWGMLEDSRMQLRSGAMAKKAADSNAFGTLLGTAGSIGMMAYSMGGKASTSGKAPSLFSDANSMPEGGGLGSGGTFINNRY